MRSITQLRTGCLQLAICCALVLFFVGGLWADVIWIGDSRATEPDQKARIELAAQAVREHRLADARQALQELCQADTDESHAEIVLAELQTKLGMEAEARKTLDLLSASDCEPFELRLAFCRLAVAEGRWFDGFTHAQLAAKASPPQRWSVARTEQQRSALALLTALCCEGRGDWTGVLTAIKPVLANKPPPQAWLLSGKASFHLQQLSEAQEAFTKYCQQAQSQDTPELLLAGLYEQAGQFAVAEEWFRKATQATDSSHADRAKLAFARFLLWSNRPQEMTTWLAGEFADPKDKTEQQYLSALQLRMGQKYVEAQNILAALHQQHSSSFAFSNQLALVLVESADEALRSRALQIAESNVRNHANLADAWATLGWIQFRLGDVVRAEKNLIKAMQDGVPSRDTARYLAQVKTQLGDTQLADRLEKVAQAINGPLFIIHTTHPPATNP